MLKSSACASLLRLLALNLLVFVGLTEAQAQISTQPNEFECTPATSTTKLLQFNCACSGTVNWTLTPLPPATPITFPSNVGTSVSQIIPVGCYTVQANCNGSVFNGSDFCVVQAPAPTIALAPGQVCPGGSATVSAQGLSPTGVYNYIWAGTGCPAGNVASYTCTPGLTATGSTLINLTVQDTTTGCISTVTSTNLATVALPAQPAFSAPNLADCNAPVDIAFTQTSSSLANATYNWLVDGTSVGSGPSFTHTFPSTGVYSVCLSQDINNTNGCEQQACQEVTIFETSDLNISAPASVCAGSTTNFNLSISQSGFSSVSWTLNGTSLPCSGSNCSVSLPNTGTQTIAATVTYSAGCSFTTSHTIDVTPAPALVLSTSTPGPFCTVPTNVELTADIDPGASIVWTSGGTTLGTANALSHTLTSNGTTTITATVTQAGIACPTTASQSFVVDPPSINYFLFGDDGNNCVGTPYSVTPSSGETGCSPPNCWLPDTDVLLSFDPGDGSGVVTFTSWTAFHNHTHTYSATGAYTTTLTATNSAGCTAVDDFLVTVFPGLNPSFTPINIVACTGQTVNFTAIDPDGDQYCWYFGDGCFNCDDEQTIGYSYEEPGVYDVTLEISNDGCTVSQTVEAVVTVYGPSADFDFATDCETPNVFEFAGATPSESQSWSIPGATIADATADTTSATFASGGSYQACLTVNEPSNPNNCFSHTLCKEVLVALEPPFFTVSPSSGCSPLVVDVDAGGDFIVEWTVNNGIGNSVTTSLPTGLSCYGTSVDFNPVWNVPPGALFSPIMPYDNLTGLPFSITYTTPGSYTINVTAENYYGCPFTLSDTVEVTNNVSGVSISAAFTEACPDYAVDLTFNGASFPNGLFDWFYILGTGTPVVFDSGGNATTTLALSPAPTLPLTVGVTVNDPLCGDTWQTTVVPPSFGNFNLNQPGSVEVCKNDTVTVQLLPCTIGSIADSKWLLDGVIQQENGIGCPPPFSFSSAVNGSFEICLRITNQLGCTQDRCTTIVVDSPEAEIVLEQSAALGCNIPLTVSTIPSDPTWGYYWQLTNAITGDQSIAIDPLFTFAIQGGNYDLLLLLENANGCTAILDSANVLGFPAIENFIVTPLDTVNCAPFQVGFEVPNPDTDFFTYSWFWDQTSPCTNTSNNSPSTVFTFDCAGTFCPQLNLTYQLFTSTNSQPDTATCTITVPCVTDIVVRDYHPEFTVTPAVLCQNEAFTIQPTGPTATTDNCESVDLIYCATSLSGLAGCTPDPVDPLTYSCMPDTNGLVPIAFTAHYAQCEAEIVQSIEVLPLPVLIPAENLYCQNHGAIDLTQLSTPSPTAVSFEGTVITNLSSFDVNPPMLLDLVYTDPTYGCTTSTTTEINLVDTLQAFWSPALPPICIDSEPLNLEPFMPSLPDSTIVGQQILNYCTSPPFATNLVDPGCLPESATVQLIPIVAELTNGFGCVSLIDTAVAVHPLPLLTLSTPDVCIGEAVNVGYTVQTPGSSLAYDSLWVALPSGGALNFTPAPGSPYVFTTNLPGPHEWGIFATSSIGCSNSMTSESLVHSFPIPSFTSVPLCENTEASLTSTSTTGGSLSLDGVSIINWSLGNIPLPSGTTTSISPDFWGETEICIEAISAFGCAQDTCVTQFIHPAPVLALTATDHCFQSDAAIEWSASVPQGSVSTDSLWVTELADGLYNFSAFEFPEPGFYEVNYTATSDQGCISQTQVDVEVFPLPIALFSVADSTVCFDEGLFITNLSSIAPPYEIGTYIWRLSNEVIGNAFEPVVAFPSPGTYELQLEVISTDGCVSAQPSNMGIEVYPLPVAGFSWLPVAPNYVESELVFVDESVSSVEWLYQFPNGSSSTEQNPEYFFNTFGSYAVTQIVWNVFQCDDTLRKQVEVAPYFQVFVPNAFTPDNDDINEVFLPVLTGANIAEYTLTVWSRWGELVHSTNDPTEGWRGNVRGGDHYVQTDVYLWQLQVRSEGGLFEEFTGHVTVVR